MGATYTANYAAPVAEAAAKGTPVGSHLRDWDDVKDLPYFPSGTTSLLSKALTPAIWEQCKDRRDRFGFSFKQAIFSGCKWTNSGVGVYSGSHDSYYAFAPLFDRVIEMYHGHTPSDKHIVSMDHTQLKCPPFPADED